MTYNGTETEHNKNHNGLGFFFADVCGYCEDSKARHAKTLKLSGMEATHLRRAYREMKEAGNPIVSVYDGEETTKVNSAAEMLEVVYSVDECWLEGKVSGSIYVVLGNEWDEVICDYSLDARTEQAMNKVMDWVESRNVNA